MLAFRIVSRSASRRLVSAVINSNASVCCATSRPSWQSWLRTPINSAACLSTSARATASSSSSTNIPIAKLSSEDLGKLIYTAPKANADSMRMVKLLSFSTTIFSAVLLPLANYKLYQEAMEQASTLAALIFSNAVAVLVLLSPLLLHHLVKRFALQIYYNSATDTFTTVHYNFFLQRRAHRFHSNEIIDPEKEAKKSLFALSTVVVRGKHILFSPSPILFTDMEAFEKLTRVLLSGDDKPAAQDDDD
uniref:Transmembrane protein 70 n=1 Tax=Plectus sambesii TaxID=2011161 RepID=A0A914WMZ0_9BILA